MANGDISKPNNYYKALNNLPIFGHFVKAWRLDLPNQIVKFESKLNIYFDNPYDFD